MNFTPQDKYFQRAKEQGFRARSAFKLLALNERFGFLKPGQMVLDLGAAPGSFLQILSQSVGSRGRVIGIDLQPIEPFTEKNVCTHVGDIFDEALLEKILKEESLNEFDLITSDLAPKTSGIKFVDASASLELNQRVVQIAKAFLKKGGTLVLKALPGFNEGELIGPLKALFKAVRKYRPAGVRATSGEFYLVGLKKLS